MPIFWYKIFNKEGPNMKKDRVFITLHFTATTLLPTICVFVGCTPVVMEFIARRTRLLEHSAEVDQSIISSIYYGRKPKKQSFESDRTDNKNKASFIGIPANQKDYFTL